VTSALGVGGLLLMYVGNLETYQGIDLLLESFALALKQNDRAELVIVGGQASDIQKYERKCWELGIGAKVRFLGPQPVERLGEYLSHADILVSPRIKGNNTPMKLYSYLHSGKPVLATNLPTHTQLIDKHVALLVEPQSAEFSKAMLRLIDDNNLRVELGMAGKKFIEEKFTYRAFREKLNGLFDWLETGLRGEDNPRGISGGSSKVPR
jgi:glycosyltransferase involved in cell wall biosynthesis